MELEDARIGMRARVNLNYRKAYLQELVGTIKRHYEAPNCTAFEVLFPDGQRQLFWDHQLEEVSPRPKRGWVLW